jgi:hypothetical protein
VTKTHTKRRVTTVAGPRIVSGCYSEVEEKKLHTIAIKNTQACAKQRGKVQTPSGVTNSGHKSTGQHPGLPVPAFLPSEFQ